MKKKLIIEVPLENYFEILKFHHKLMNDLCQYDGLKACLDKIIKKIHYRALFVLYFCDIKTTLKKILCQNKNKKWNI